jgi:uncharacterized UPF0160 family protein
VTSTSSKSELFYTSILGNLHTMDYVVVLKTSDQQGIKSVKEMKEKSKIEGCIWIHADKNMGVVLLRASDVLDAEKRIMVEMRAEVVYENADAILDRLFKMEKNLRSDLKTEQKDFMKSFRPLNKNIVRFPFMKIQAKIHKLTKKQIAEKDVASLKFRPINDSKFL